MLREDFVAEDSDEIKAFIRRSSAIRTIARMLNKGEDAIIARRERAGTERLSSERGYAKTAMQRSAADR